MQATTRRALICGALSLLACATVPSSGRETRNLITTEQIVESRAQNAYQVVETLKPEWLSSRGPTSVTDPTPASASVYFNGTHVGGLEFLRTVPVIDIAEIRYYPTGEASARFGMGHPRGVIAVSTKGT